MSVHKLGYAQGFGRGVRLLCRAIEPTLGPQPRFTLVGDRHSRELLDCGAVIARRVIALPRLQENTGAMFLRHLLWQVYEQVGDGTATAAVLFDRVYHDGARYLAAGNNPMALRRHLEHLSRRVQAQLTQRATTFDDETRLRQFALSVCHDPELAALLAEIFSIIGEYGHLEIHAGGGRKLEREYIEGMTWRAGLHARDFLQGKATRTLENAAILLTDGDILSPEDLLPVLTAAVHAGIKAVLLMAAKLSESVIGFLNANQERITVMAVKMPEDGSLDDLAVLTGARPILKVTGQGVTALTLSDLGRARKVWANRQFIGVIGGKGDPRQIRRHIAGLRQSHQLSPNPGLAERLGKLLGGSAMLHIGGATPSEMAARKSLAQRTADALRGSLSEGIVLGGGLTLMRIAAELHPANPQDPDEVAACRMVQRALQAPFQIVFANAGFSPAEAISALTGKPAISIGPDGITSEPVWDSVKTLRVAVQTAISGAALGLTVDTLVRRAEPEVSLTP